MTVEIVEGVLVIRIPVQDPPPPSKTGKTFIIASSNGNRTTGVSFNGKPLVVGVNAYIAR